MTCKTWSAHFVCNVFVTQYNNVSKKLMFLLCAVRCALVLKCYKVFCCALILDSLQSFLLNVRSVLLQNFLLCADALIFKMSCWTLLILSWYKVFCCVLILGPLQSFLLSVGSGWVSGVHSMSRCRSPVRFFNFNELINFFNALCLLFIMLKKIIN